MDSGHIVSVVAEVFHLVKGKNATPKTSRQDKDNRIETSGDGKKRIHALGSSYMVILPYRCSDVPFHGNTVLFENFSYQGMFVLFLFPYSGYQIP